MVRYYAWIVMIAVILVTYMTDVATTASCCQNGQTTHTKETWFAGVEDLDRLHKMWLEKKILDSLNLRKAPENASRWKRNKFNSTAEPVDTTSDDEEILRRFTLRVVGSQIGQIQILRHLQNNIKHTNNTMNNSNKCSAHYLFKAHLSQQNRRTTTQMQNANIELPSDASLILHMNSDDNDHGTGVVNRKNGAVTIDVHNLDDDDIVQGRNRIFDVGSLIFPYWSTTNGVSISITVKSRELCKYVDEFEFYPVLKFELREVQSKRHNKRHLFSSSNVVQKKRDNMIIDCEMAWDQAFLQNTSNALYDSIMPCCRRKVSLDFTQLGWDSWVVAPLVFDSYYCIGRCSSFGGFATDNTDGPSFYTEIMNIQRRARASGLMACCSPVKFAPMTITVMIADNEQMTQTLEDVIVSHCGCM